MTSSSAKGLSDVELVVLVVVAVDELVDPGVPSADMLLPYGLVATQ